VDSSGLLDQLIEHEMGHLLGFGTVWDLDNLVHDTAGSNPWFSGPNAQAAFHRALPTYSDKAVPVEAEGGSGTTLSHWRESVMTNELMTGFLNQGVNPLSAITIESMADLGYTVNEQAAEPWPTPASSMAAAARARLTGGAPATTTTVLRPRFWVTGSGQLSPIPH
jgi:Leishmanolysin